MKYRNIKTGAVIDITSKLTDKSWELVNAPMDSVNKEENEAPKKKSVKVDKKKKG